MVLPVQSMDSKMNKRHLGDFAPLREKMIWNKYSRQDAKARRVVEMISGDLWTAINLNFMSFG